MNNLLRHGQQCEQTVQVRYCNSVHRNSIVKNSLSYYWLRYNGNTCTRARNKCQFTLRQQRTIESTKLRKNSLNNRMHKSGFSCRKTSSQNCTQSTRSTGYEYDLPNHTTGPVAGISPISASVSSKNKMRNLHTASSPQPFAADIISCWPQWGQVMAWLLLFYLIFCQERMPDVICNQRATALCATDYRTIQS